MHTRVDRNIELCGISTIQFSKSKIKKYIIILRTIIRTVKI